MLMQLSANAVTHILDLLQTPRMRKLAELCDLQGGEAGQALPDGRHHGTLLVVQLASLTR